MGIIIFFCIKLELCDIHTNTHENHAGSNIITAACMPNNLRDKNRNQLGIKRCLMFINYILKLLGDKSFKMVINDGILLVG